jgi:hypothetical protein
VIRYASDLPDFSDLLRAAAEWKRLPASIVEKDYYLTRSLDSLRARHDGEFILKGGTSLSKGWNLLDRFSEDLDILVRVEAEAGAAKRDTRLRAMRDTIQNTPGLKLDSTDTRTRAETGVSRTAVYLYECVATDVPGLGRNILFEAGYRGRADAAVKKSIQSWVTEYAAAKGHSNLAEDLRPFEIELQEVKRTFVEKGFAIHGAYFKDRCANKMRHYYDFVKLLQLSEIRGYIDTPEYRMCVTDVKKISEKAFRDQAVPDGNSLSNSPAFAPSESDFTVLEGHYKREAEIFFSTPPSLKSMLDEISRFLRKL